MNSELIDLGQASPVEERAKRIKVLIFDVDGVMTDGSLMIGDDGQ